MADKKIYQRVRGGLCNNLTLEVNDNEKKKKIDAMNKVEEAKLNDETCRI